MFKVLKKFNKVLIDFITVLGHTQDKVIVMLNISKRQILEIIKDKKPCIHFTHKLKSSSAYKNSGLKASNNHVAEIKRLLGFITLRRSSSKKNKIKKMSVS